MMKNDVIRFQAMLKKELANWIPNKYIVPERYQELLNKEKELSPDEYKKITECNFIVDGD